MKPVTLLVAGALALGSLAPAHATGVDREELRAKLALILKRLVASTPPRTSIETISCSGADGTTVSFTTSTAKDRQLTSPVRVKVGGQTATVPALLVTTYANEDAAISMKAYKALSTAELFSFKTKLVPTTAPQVDEVATYAGTASVNGGANRDVTCSALRPGAGLLKVQAISSQLAVSCIRQIGPTEIPLLAYTVAGKSLRLQSVLTEQRSDTDFEISSSSSIAQFSLTKALADIVTDDEAGEGHVNARLMLTGVRVPTNQPAADPAIYGMWSGTYQRFDAGRELNEAVTCIAFSPNTSWSPSTTAVGFQRKPS